MMMMNSNDFTDHVYQCCRLNVAGMFRTLCQPGFGFRLYDKGTDHCSRHALRLCDNPQAPLLVCHADTVVDSYRSDLARNYAVEGSKVTSVQLDDRLGIAIMLHAIATDSVLSNCHMLVCDNEEIGQSTASSFMLRWQSSLPLQALCQPTMLIELDRRGTDVVCYEFESVMLTGLLRHYGFNAGVGSFSDICHLQGMGVAGFNVGIGYNQEHTARCSADLDATTGQVSKLETLVESIGDLPLCWEPDKHYRPKLRRTRPGNIVTPDIYTGPVNCIDDSLPLYTDPYSYASKREGYSVSTPATVRCDDCQDMVPKHDATPWGQCMLCQDCYDILVQQP